MPLMARKREGWTTPVRRMGEALLMLAQSRIELLAVELHEQKLRVLNLLMWLAVSAALLLAGLLVALGTVAIFAWNAGGYLGLIALAVVSVGAGFALFKRLCRQVRNGPAPLAATIAEFRKDRECLFGGR